MKLPAGTSAHFKEINILPKAPNIPPKEPCIYSKELNVLSKKPYIQSAEPICTIKGRAIQ